MDSKSMTRKEFVTLTFTLLGGATAAAACSSSSNNTGTGGTNGAGGSLGSGGASGGACTDPLSETQDADTTGHTHTIAVAASLLSLTTDQTLTTSGVMNNTVGIADHMHMITFTAADLAMLKGGGSVDVMSMIAVGHTHNYRVTCHAATGTGGANGSAGAEGSAGANGSAGASGSAGTDGSAGTSGVGGH